MNEFLLLNTSELRQCEVMPAGTDWRCGILNRGEQQVDRKRDETFQTQTCYSEFSACFINLTVFFLTVFYEATVFAREEELFQVSRVLDVSFLFFASTLLGE